MTHDGRIEAQLTVPASTTIEVTNNGGGPTTVTLTAGTYFPSTLVTHLQTVLTAQRAPSAGAWSVTLSTGAAGTGKVTIAMSAGTFSITWTSTNLRDVLGFTAGITAQTTATGASQARGLWSPDCPLAMDGDPAHAPPVTDQRETESPDGFILSHVSVVSYRHSNVMWEAVARDRVWLGAETTTNASLERFLRDAHWGIGHAWFRPSSLMKIYDTSGLAIGRTHNGGSGVTGWRLTGMRRLQPRTTQDRFTGLWRIQVPEIVSPG